MAALEFAERDARAEAVGSQLGALHGGGGLVDFRPAVAAMVNVREGGDLVALGIVASFCIDRLCKKDFESVRRDVDALNLIYNFADFVNKIAFGMVIWYAATQETQSMVEEA